MKKLIFTILFSLFTVLLNATPSITYTAGTDIIDCDSFIVTNPCTMDSIYIADTLNAWGQVTKLTCGSNGYDAYNCNARLQIGDGTDSCYFQSTDEYIWLYDYFKVMSKGRMILGDTVTDASNPSAYPRWGTRLVIDRATNPDGSYCYFVRTGGELYVYNSQIVLESSGLLFDTQTGSYTKFWFSSFSGNSVANTTYIRFFGKLTADNMWLNHCRNMNFAGEYDTLSQGLIIYCNTNNLQIRDNEAWIYDSQLLAPKTCACKTLRFSAYGQANHVDPVGFDRTKVCVTSYADNWQKMWHRFARRITTVDGDSVEGAIVEVWDIGDTLIYCDTTDVTGWTDMDLVLEWKTSGTGNPPSFTDYSPHRIKVYGEGILTYEQPLEIDERMDTWEIKVYRSPYNSIKGLE